MRQPVIARFVLALALLLSGALVAQAAPASQQSELSVATARIAVVHAAPFAADLADTNVTIVASAFGQDVLLTNDLQFRDTMPYMAVPPGTYDVRVYPGMLDLPIPSGTMPAIQQSVTLTPNTDYTVLAVGTSPDAASAYPLQLQLLTDSPAPSEPGMARARVIHAAPFAPTPAATAVDVLTTDNESVGITNLQYPNATEFLSLPADMALNLKVVATGTVTPLFTLPPLTLPAASAVSVIAVGGANGYDPGVVVLNPQQANARVRFVHAAPFASGDAEVTLRLNGQTYYNDFDFGDATLYRDLPAGVYVAEVLAGTTPVLTTPLNLMGGASYTVVATGTAPTGAFPLELRTLMDDTTPAGSTTARLRVLHAAPFAPLPSGTAVSVRTQAGDVLPGLNLENISYGDLREGIVVPSGMALDLKIVLAADPSQTVIDLPPLMLPATGAFTVIAVGGANEQEARVLMLNDLSMTRNVYLPIVVR